MSRAAAKPVKQLVIKNFKVTPTLPDNFEEVTWIRLRAAVNAIHAKQPVSDSLETLYRATEDMCLHKLDANLYQRLRSECQAHITYKLDALQPHAHISTEFLPILDNCWRDHCEQMHFIRSIFLCLDRKYVIQTANVKSLWDMGLELFRQIIATNPIVTSKLLEGILQSIECERQGEIIDKALLRRLLKMLDSLGIYGTNFEQAFLQATTTYYDQEGKDKIETLSPPLYLRHVQTRLTEENHRVENYLISSTKKDLISIVEDRLLAIHIQTILEKGFDSIMEIDQRICHYCIN